MSTLLTTFKYSPAFVHTLALERAYLRNFFSSAFDLPLVILEAESGYGKTTTLSSVAGREGYSARWLTLDESDRDMDRFVYNILQAVYGRNIPEENAPLTVRQAISLILGAINELAVSSLILDNFENVMRAGQITALLEQLIDELPPFTKLIIASKKMPNLRRGNRRSSRSAILTQSDLRFDVDDVSQYFLKVHNYVLTPQDAALITERTKGKPVLINLLGQLTRNLPNYLRVDWSQLPLSPEGETIKLLLREVIAKLPRSLARVVQDLKSAEGLPSDGISPVCNLLDILAERHCLVQQYSDGDGMIINVPHEILLELSALI